MPTRLVTPDVWATRRLQRPDRGGLLLDPVAQVCNAVALDHRDGPFELHRRGAELREQRRTPAQHDWHQLDADLVEKPGLQALPGHLPAVDSDVLVPGQLFSLCHRGLDAVADEDEVFV